MTQSCYQENSFGCGSLKVSWESQNFENCWSVLAWCRSEIFRMSSVDSAFEIFVGNRRSFYTIILDLCTAVFPMVLACLVHM